MQIDLACPVGTRIMSETLFIMNEFKLDPTSIKARIIRPRLKIREGVRRYAPEINLQGPAGSWLGVWKMKQTNKQTNKWIKILTDFWLGVHPRAEFYMLRFIKQAFVHIGYSFQHSVMLLFVLLFHVQLDIALILTLWSLVSLIWRGQPSVICFYFWSIPIKKKRTGDNSGYVSFIH